MGRPRKPVDLDAAIAAYLFAVRPGPDRLKSQKEVAREMGVTEVALSRLLKQAREAGMLRLEYVEQAGLTRGRLVEAIAQRQAMQSDQAIIEHFSLNQTKFPHRLSSVRIYETPLEDTTTREGWEATILALGHAAASRTREFLLNADNIGVAWGRTLSSAVQGAQALGGEPWSDGSRARVFPLWGEMFTRPLDREGSRFTYSELSSSWLAERIALLIHGPERLATRTPGGEHLSFSLAAVPALIHRRHTGSDLKAIYGSLYDNAYYREIFGGPRREERQAGEPCLARQMQTALVAVGAAGDDEELFWHPQMAEHSGFDINVLKKFVCGDIGGVLVGHDERSTEVKKEQATKIIKETVSHWTGVRRQHVLWCAHRAEGLKHQGVVVYAAGAVRHSIVKAALQKGLINHLIIDQSLARKLAETLAPAGRPSRRKT